MLTLLGEVLLFLLVLLAFNIAARGVSLINGVDLASQLDHIVRLLLLLGFKLRNSLVKLGLTMLSLELLLHGKSHRALVQGLVSSDSHSDFITNAQEKQAALRQIKSHLADDFIKALREKLLTNRADATLTSLALHKLLIKHLSESGNVDSRGWLVTDVLNPVLA